MLEPPQKGFLSPFVGQSHFSNLSYLSGLFGSSIIRGIGNWGLKGQSWKLKAESRY
jgi:hypothetical protein